MNLYRDLLSNAIYVDVQRGPASQAAASAAALAAAVAGTAAAPAPGTAAELLPTLTIDPYVAAAAASATAKVLPCQVCASSWGASEVSEVAWAALLLCSAPTRAPAASPCSPAGLDTAHGQSGQEPRACCRRWCGTQEALACSLGGRLRRRLVAHRTRRQPLAWRRARRRPAAAAPQAGGRPAGQQPAEQQR